MHRLAIPSGIVAMLRLLTAAATLPAGAQLPPIPQMPFGGGGAAPSTGSLLDDLRAIQGGGTGGAAAGALGGGLGGASPLGSGLGGGAFGGLGASLSGGLAGSTLGGLGAGANTGLFGGGAPLGGGVPVGGMAGASLFGAAAPPMGGGGAPPMMGGGLPQPPPPSAMSLPSAAEAPEDMACAAGPSAAVWAQVKELFRQAVGQGPVGRDVLTAALESTITGLKQVGALSPERSGECGFGKFCLQMLSFAAIEDAANLVQLFSGFEEITSPVLTMLLDVPWETIAQSGWPLFGLLAQIASRRTEVPQDAGLNPAAVDGLDEAASATFFTELLTAMGSQNTAATEKVAGDFLSNDVAGKGSLGPLTAIAAQLMAAKPEAKVPLSQALQVAFKQVIGNGPELDVALGTRWPLWILLHAGVDSLAN